MMQNLAQIAQLMRGRDPEAVVMSMVQNSKINDPTITSLINFAQCGDANSVVNLATTLFAQQGLDLNQELSEFFNLMK